MVQGVASVRAEMLRRDARSTRLPLSVCVLTRGRSARLGAILSLLRPLASEIVVAVDDRAPEEAERLTAVADDVILFPHREPADSQIPWLHALCRRDWILNVDDDEVPSAALLARLPSLLAADVSHWWFARRWLVGDGSRYLDEPPWTPDYQLRLYRNDPATLRFSDAFHRPVVADGPAGFALEPLWHLDCVLNSFECRKAKALSYERERRGLRVAGLAHNSGFYLPELQPDVRTAPVPEDDLALVAGVLDAEPLSGEPRTTTRRAARAEIDARWPAGQAGASTWTGRLTALADLPRLRAGARHTVAVSLRNDSTVVWPRGAEASPLILVGTRWRDAAGAEQPGLHTPLPADLRPASTLTVPVHVAAPEVPGRYSLVVDLVHEHVRWFGCEITLEVDVLPSRRIALAAHDTLEAALDDLHLVPNLEPIIFGATLAPEHEHTSVPGFGPFLLTALGRRIGPRGVVGLAHRTLRVLRAASAMRDGRAYTPLGSGADETLAALATCEALHVDGPDWAEDAAETRELWRLAATAGAARRLGVPVDVRGLGTRRGIDLILARLAARR